MWMTAGPKTSGNGRYPCRMSACNIKLLDDRIKYVNRRLPNVFARKMKPISELVDYKYTELRQFLLYTGKLLLLDIRS